MKNRHTPLPNENTTARPEQGKGTVNRVFEKIMENQQPYSPLPFRTLVRNVSDSPSWQKVVRQHAKNRTPSRGAPDELIMLEKLVRNALGKARETSRESLEKA